MKRGIAVLASLSALLAVGYFTASKWAIRHDTVTFKDPSRKRFVRSPALRSYKPVSDITTCAIPVPMRRRHRSKAC